MAAQHKSEGWLGPERKEGEGEHGVRMKSPNVTEPLNRLPPSDIADDILMRNGRKMYGGAAKRMHAAYAGSSGRCKTIRPDTRALWSHCGSTYFNEYFASVRIEREKKKKKKGFSDGLFLDCSHLPPFCFLLPLCLCTILPDSSGFIPDPLSPSFCLIIDFPVNLLKVQVVGWNKAGDAQLRENKKDQKDQKIKV